MSLRSLLGLEGDTKRTWSHETEQKEGSAESSEQERFPLVAALTPLFSSPSAKKLLPVGVKLIKDFLAANLREIDQVASSALSLTVNVSAERKAKAEAPRRETAREDETDEKHGKEAEGKARTLDYVDKAFVGHNAAKNLGCLTEILYTLGYHKSSPFLLPLLQVLKAGVNAQQVFQALSSKWKELHPAPFLSLEEILHTASSDRTSRQVMEKLFHDTKLQKLLAAVPTIVQDSKKKNFADKLQSSVSDLFSNAMSTFSGGKIKAAPLAAESPQELLSNILKMASTFFAEQKKELTPQRTMTKESQLILFPLIMKSLGKYLVSPTDFGFFTVSEFSRFCCLLLLVQAKPKSSQATIQFLAETELDTLSRAKLLSTLEQFEKTLLSDRTDSLPTETWQAIFSQLKSLIKLPDLSGSLLSALLPTAKPVADLNALSKLVEISLWLLKQMDETFLLFPETFNTHSASFSRLRPAISQLRTVESSVGGSTTIARWILVYFERQGKTLEVVRKNFYHLSRTLQTLMIPGQKADSLKAIQLQITAILTTSRKSLENFFEGLMSCEQYLTLFAGARCESREMTQFANRFYKARQENMAVMHSHISLILQEGIIAIARQHNLSLEETRAILSTPTSENLKSDFLSFMACLLQLNGGTKLDRTAKNKLDVEVHKLKASIQRALPEPFNELVKHFEEESFKIPAAHLQRTLELMKTYKSKFDIPVVFDERFLTINSDLVNFATSLNEASDIL